MTDNRLFAAWLRSFAGLFALAGVLALSACGGGSGAPNNPYAPGPTVPGPLSVLPDTATAYSGVPTTLTVNGGTPPYRAFSSDSAILPVAQTVAGNSVLLLAGSVSVDTLVTVTVQDAALASATSVVTVRAAPLLPALITVVPNGDCTVGAETLCSGGTGVASVVVTGPGGGGIAGRVVRFDVISGAYPIQSENPATPLAATVNVVTDATGKAAVGLVVNVGAPTQVASIRATDVRFGQPGDRPVHDPASDRRQPDPVGHSHRASSRSTARRRPSVRRASPCSTTSTAARRPTKSRRPSRVSCRSPACRSPRMAAASPQRPTARASSTCSLRSVTRRAA